MIIAKVMGSVVSTIKDSRLSGYKMALVQQYSPLKEKVSGEPFVAVDILGSGRGSIVCVARGGAARLLSNRADAESTPPVDATIVAILDDVDFAK